jgi:hypothetical protein
MSFVSSGISENRGVTPAAGALYQQVLTGQGLPPQLTNYGYHPLTDNHVPAYFLFNLNGTYSFDEELLNGLRLFTQVNNVFNKQPPFAVRGGTFGPVTATAAPTRSSTTPSGWHSASASGTSSELSPGRPTVGLSGDSRNVRAISNDRDEISLGEGIVRAATSRLASTK